MGGSGGLGSGGLGSGGITGGFSLSTLSGTTTTTSSGRGGGGSYNYSSSSFMGPYYGNPYSLGMMGSNNTPSGTMSFGSALYNSTGGTTATRGGRGGNTGTFGSTGIGTVSRGLTGTTNTTFNGASSAGIMRVPAYVTVITFKPNVVPPLQMQAQVQTSIQQSLAQATQLTTGRSLQVVMDGPVVVLRGNVADEEERRLAENLARLTPGVRDVRNELVPRDTASGQQ
jgi:hypothetical protein